MKKILVGIVVFIVVLIGAAIAVPFLFKDKIVQAARMRLIKNSMPYSILSLLMFPYCKISRIFQILH
jgi:preprotein translocase subunit SecY